MIKLTNLTTIILILLCQLATLADYEEERTTNILTIRESFDKKKSYPIKKISKKRMTPTGPRVIHIETYSDASCIIPLDRIVSAPRVNYEGCTHCFDDDIEMENFYTDLFLNRRDPHITCDKTDGKLVGFQFLGGTTVNGKSMFTSHALSLDTADYRNGKFQEEKEKLNPIQKALNQVEDVLLDLIIDVGTTTPNFK